MNAQEFIEKITKQRRKNDRAKTIKTVVIAILAVGAASLVTGVIYSSKIKKQTKNFTDNLKDNLDDVNDVLETKADAFKYNAENTTNKFSNCLNEFHKKNINIRDDIKKGFHKVKKAIDTTTDNIVEEIKD